jgi:hypothetical protein
MAQPPRLTLSEVGRRGVTSVHDLRVAARDIFRLSETALQTSPALTITSINTDSPATVAKLALAKETYVQHFEHIRILIQTAQAAVGRMCPIFACQPVMYQRIC